MTTNKVGFWTPVKWEDHSHQSGTTADQYFSYSSGRTVTCIRDEKNIQFCEKSKPLSKSQRCLQGFLTFLKVVSLITLLVPFIFLIIKLAARSNKNYRMIPQISKKEPSASKSKLDDKNPLLPKKDTPSKDESADLRSLHTPPKTPPLSSDSDDETTSETSTSSESDSPEEPLNAASAPGSSIQPEKETPFLVLIGRMTSFRNLDTGMMNVLRRETSFQRATMGVLRGEYTDTEIAAVEEIRTINTLQRTQSILRKEIENLQKQPNSPMIHRKIERCRRMLEACLRFDGFDKPLAQPTEDFDQWLGSWYFRALLKDHFDELTEDASEEDHLTAYKTALDEFIAAPINFREQSIECETETARFLRCGALYDPTNPYTHLSELRDLFRQGRRAINKKKTEIEKIQKDNSKNFKVWATTAYALEQLGQIEETIRIREEILQRQALQIVWAQVEIALKKAEPFPHGQLRIAHLALLNEDNIGMDSNTGWYHHEGYEILDMDAVYEFLHGKAIYFDGTGPAIDADGAIHLPKIAGQTDGDLVTLQTGFFNISIQGKSKETLQTRINRQSCAKLGLNGKLSIKRPGKETCPTTVEHATLLHRELEDAGFQTIISCLSGKDRTGWVAYQVVLDQIVAAGGIRPEGLETAGYNNLKGVLLENFGDDAIKVSKRKLRGVSHGERAKLLKQQMDGLIQPLPKLRGHQKRKRS